MNRVLLLASLVAAAGRCGSSSHATGGLYVIVHDASMANVADAVVTTDPATKSLTTDALGSVIFPSIAAGVYKVIAAHPTLGSAEAAVNVMANQLSQVTLRLAKTAPGDGGAGASGGQPGTAGTAGTAGASGGAGGVAAAGGAGAQDGGAGAAPEGGAGAGAASVVLATPTKDTNNVNLSWTSAPTFPSYRIYRGTGGAGAFDIIDILNAPATLTYADKTATLGTTYRYRVGGIAAGGAETLSNIQMIVAGVYVDVASQVQKMIVDPKRPYLYAIDKVNNSLHFVNTTTNVVESTIFVGSTPTDIDINLEGSEAYVANFGSTEIAVVNLDTRMKARSLFVDTSKGTWQGNPYRLACTTGDTVVYTSNDQWQDLKLVSAADGTFIAYVSSFYAPYLAASPDGTRVYATGDDVNGLTRADIIGTMLKIVDGQGDIGGLGGGPVWTTRDGTYVFSGTNKFLANNLKSNLGTFSEPILLTTHDGSVAVGKMAIHDGTTFGIKSQLPLQTPTMAIGPDDHTLYLFDTMTSRIYLYKL